MNKNNFKMAKNPRVPFQRNFKFTMIKSKIEDITNPLFFILILFAARIAHHVKN